MITLELPFPPTANKYWQVARNRIIKTKRARDYQKQVQGIILTKLRELSEWRKLQVGKTLALSMAVHYPVKPGPDGDIDNLGKVCVDSLQGCVFDNDRQLRHIQISKEKAEGKEGSVRVTVTECPDELEVHDGTFTVKGIHCSGS
tara:strand:- start:26 stop:460 length:435 start_codon:yes stop_codon:yes gene_type:complete